MKLKSSIQFDTVEKIRRLPHSWQADDYRRLLGVLDIDDVGNLADDELEDMVSMALQDREPEEAMQVILTDFCENRFTKGQVQNLCEELKEDRSWEEYPDLADQKALYQAVDLLNTAFPYDYPAPTATRVRLKIRARGLAEAHGQHPLDPAILLRGIGRCQDQSNILNRFFAEQIAGKAFPEAASVVWGMEATAAGSDTLDVMFFGSSYWYGRLEDEFESSCLLEWPEENP